MTLVKVQKQSGSVVCVNVSGHSGYKKRGFDIVCAAVSAVTQTALLGLINVAHAQVEYKADEAKGVLTFCIAEADTQKRTLANAILETMLLGLLDIEKGYPENVKVEVIE